MPWNMKDYPDSLKNLSTTVRKKAIDIANALVEDGYDEGRAIPIATEQAKEWYGNASKAEKEDYEKHGDPQKHDHQYKSRPELLDEDVLLYWEDEQWVVKTKTAKKASKLFDRKDEAIEHGKSIAENKGTTLHIYLQNGHKEKTINN